MMTARENVPGISYSRPEILGKAMLGPTLFGPVGVGHTYPWVLFHNSTSSKHLGRYSRQRTSRVTPIGLRSAGR